MKRKDVSWFSLLVFICFVVVVGMGTVSAAFAQAIPGGTLDPTTIPKYVTPLVIPPEMPKSGLTSPAPAADYDIAVRQFKQQILPGGIWGAVFTDPTSTTGGTIGPFPATTVWSYGRAADPLPDSSGITGGAAGVAPAPASLSSFNYPAFTVENTTGNSTKVRWINGLVDGGGNYLSHLFNVDQTLHWANPPKANCVMMPDMRTDCETAVAAPYTGPVPMAVHVHGAHVQAHSDGYPEAWWLPAANNIPAGYGTQGTHYTQADNTNAVPGSAYYSYENTQAATTLWYHDHTLGMTRLNVYAGPAGFWLLRGGSYDLTTGLPVSAPTGTGDPNFDAVYRNTIREVPIAIQDRSFNSDGSLFYPADRSFFDGFTGPYIGDTVSPSDMSGIWNPEAFFNTMVVNGTTWPFFEVANGRYRLRLLNGCNSRTLNLSMFIVSDPTDTIPGNGNDVLGAEVPFYQIGAEQGFLPNVVEIKTGQYAILPGNGTIPAPISAASVTHALLMMPAERADVIVDFTGMPDGTRIRMINNAPDAPFGGLLDAPADPLTTGQVMDFIVVSALTTTADSLTTAPESLVLPAEPALGAATNTRKLSLNELSSDQVCVQFDMNGVPTTLFSRPAGDTTFLAACTAAAGEPMGPRQAQLGVVTSDGLGGLIPVTKKWSDPITELPSLNGIEIWEIYNTTVDAHPIHVHLVAFEVINREGFDPVTLASSGTVTLPHPNEAGYKDTVMALPGEITRIKAKFDIEGLYVWHCHIVEHEDNEMMRPFMVTRPSLLWRNTSTGQNVLWYMDGVTTTGTGWLLANPDTNWNIVGRGDFNGDGKSDILWRHSTTGENVVWYMDGETNTGAGWLLANPDMNWTIAGVADFNGDSKPDILWRHSTSGQNVVWYMDGVTNTGAGWLTANPDMNWTIAGVADFNSDGMPDILWRHSTSGQNVVWYLNGVTNIGTGWLDANPDMNWTIVSVADFNTDGMPDVLWRHSISGQNVAWFMNGVTTTGAGWLTTNPDIAWNIVGK